MLMVLIRIALAIGFYEELMKIINQLSSNAHFIWLNSWLRLFFFYLSDLRCLCNVFRKCIIIYMDQCRHLVELDVWSGLMFVVNNSHLCGHPIVLDMVFLTYQIEREI